MQHEKTKELAMTALMTALIFTATYIIKIPNPATGGYTHMGDCMIFLGVMVLGRKQGALAGGLGGALSDLLSGAAVWVLPTFFIKYAMGWIMGLLLEKSRFKNRLIAAGTGGVFQIIAYTLVKIPGLYLQSPLLRESVCRQSSDSSFLRYCLRCCPARRCFHFLRRNVYEKNRCTCAYR